jgi:DnaK suppressor protein
MDDVRRRLLADLATSEERVLELEADLAQVISASESSNADDEHDPEGATIAFERQQLSSLLTRSRRTRSDLTSSLARLDDGSYGSCRHCGRPISAARLEARPQARSCIDCARAGPD